MSKFIILSVAVIIAAAQGHRDSKKNVGHHGHWQYFRSSLEGLGINLIHRDGAHEHAAEAPLGEVAHSTVKHHNEASSFHEHRHHKEGSRVAGLTLSAERGADDVLSITCTSAAPNAEDTIVARVRCVAPHACCARPPKRGAWPLHIATMAFHAAQQLP